MKTKIVRKNTTVKQNINENLEPTEADEEVLHLIFLNGGISYQFMIDHEGYTTKRFRRFKQLKYIKIHEEEVENEKTGKIETKYMFTLSKTGVSYAAKKGWGPFPQHYNGYEHTIKGEKLLNKLRTEKKIDLSEIINENTQKQLYSATISDEKRRLEELKKQITDEEERKKIGSISACDFLYKDKDGKMHCYEVITKNYRDNQILSKKNYSNYVIGGVFHEY